MSHVGNRAIWYPRLERGVAPTRPLLRPVIIPVPGYEAGDAFLQFCRGLVAYVIDQALYVCVSIRDITGLQRE